MLSGLLKRSLPSPLCPSRRLDVVSVLLSHVAPQRYSPCGRGECGACSIEHGSQVGDSRPVSPPFVVFRVGRLSGRRVPVVRCRRLLRGTFGASETERRSESERFRELLSQCVELDMVRERLPSFISHFECIVGLNHMPRSPDA